MKTDEELYEILALEDLVERQANLLREIALTVKGDEPESLRWGVHDLPQIIKEYSLESLSNKYRDISQLSLNMPQLLRDQYLFASWLLGQELTSLRDKLLENIDLGLEG